MVLQPAPGPLTASVSSAAIGEVPLAHFVWYRTGTYTEVHVRENTKGSDQEDDTLVVMILYEVHKYYVVSQHPTHRVYD